MSEIMVAAKLFDAFEDKNIPKKKWFVMNIINNSHVRTNNYDAHTQTTHSNYFTLN